ncbi:DeoR/GlpR family DNA-binding transcription regulator [Staphylococcus shinii]|jgi:DeoR family myo-inositol catabolism operon transcriptional repressor|uniref:DeoR/GlpR transcriptional regulator n=2 Tax=Staphylococcus shinii TaxID=2912228 RepID=A0A418IIX2_9STAP|nr:DeoR/GlpR family DNA-binding transcription regulator [Staphylococcus shinii]MBO3064834.1 DeoR/GlpR transcriptional regulator [Staphylococcus shinii]MDW8563706.1 DeoR/GlpR family DNA-binding transcription regulator [Staphylococcus shinii]MDW8566946.1 DeoR/GlpR family DNA-binding transcription regulator [Staphylococcus shinii]MDW8569882.1 DeoR/GlpR family DNA-binding transcription regulator [Staphylococcus shinii]PKI09648.1 DeoR/GlpR transcriptional regulator [Staphylococcus shinii]
MKSKRIHEIENYINEKKAASIDELSEFFNVSINTIRRDITILANMNKVKKVYGGIETIENTISQAVDYSKRNISHFEEKKHIASVAAKHIKANDVIYIDTGTTTVHILDYVNTEIPLTIISNSLDIINKASLFKNVSLFIIGEKFKYRTRSFIGIDSNTLIEKFNIDKAFMAATGIDIKNGLSNAELEENIIKKLIVSRSKYTCALVDHTKIGESTLLTFMECEELDSLITNKLPNQAFIDFFKEHNINIEI